MKSIHFLKNKAKTLEDIYNNAKYIMNENLVIERGEFNLIDISAKAIIKDFHEKIKNSNDFNKNVLEKFLNEIIKLHKTNFKGVGQPMRIALTGSKYGPGIYDIILSLGKEEVLKRLSSLKSK